jgi:glucose-1-phosphate adenylyltransferase
MITDGCRIAADAEIRHSVLGPGVIVEPGTKIIDSILLTDSIVRKDAQVARTVIDKRVEVAPNAVIGSADAAKPLTMVGKNSIVPAGVLVEPGAVINSDVVASNYPDKKVKSDQTIDKTRRLLHDL